MKSSSLRIAVLSDIHGNILALEAVAADLKNRGADVVLNLGDHLSGPLWPRETADFLIGQNWIHINGNHDRQLCTLAHEQMGPSDRYAIDRIGDNHLQWIRSLPATAEGPEGLFLCHGTPESDTEYFLETIDSGRVRLSTQAEIRSRNPKCNAGTILCGHTHVPRVVSPESGRLIINPGSVGLPAYSDDHGGFHVVENGSPHARYAVLEKRGSEWSIDLVLVDYRHDAASLQAKANGRSDWEIALRTGYMN